MGNIVLLLLVLLAFNGKGLTTGNGIGSRRKGKIIFNGDRHCDWDPCDDLGLGTCCAVTDYDWNVEIIGFREIKTHSQTIYQPLKVKSSNYDYTGANYQAILDNITKEYEGKGGTVDLDWEIEYTKFFYDMQKKDLESDLIQNWIEEELTKATLTALGVPPEAVEIIK